MRKDKEAQITIRDLRHKTKREVRQITSWMKKQTAYLERLTKPQSPWLVKRHQFAKIFRFSLMR